MKPFDSARFDTGYTTDVMPRTVPPGLLKSPTQCVAVKIVRKDGVTYGLSNSPVPFTYGGVLYQAAIGGDMSAIEDYAGTDVGNAEATLPIDDVVAYLKTQDVKGLKFENSRWTVLLIDYRNVPNGAMIVQTFRLSKTRFRETQMTMELLALLSFFKTTTGRVMNVMCDVERFGNKRCDPSQTIAAALSDSLTVSAYVNLFTADFNLSPRAVGFYSYGLATWTSGANAGIVTPIKQHTTVGGKTRIVWRTPPPYPVVAGDVATLTFGCNRTFATCKTVPNSHNPSNTNIENIKSFRLPSQDETLVVAKN